MSLLRSVPVRIAVAVLCTTFATTPAASGHTGSHDGPSDPPAGPPLFVNHDETLFEPIAAPFACGTEWSGQTRPGHGQNDWNLDFNRTSLDFGENRQHDLGQPLFAQAGGTVVHVGWQVNAGTYLDIDYGDYATRYVHLVDDSVVVEIGDTVTQGQLVALLGDTGNTPGFAHLHLEYWDSRDAENDRIWELENDGKPQTEVTFDGNVIDPGEVIVSTNCVGDALLAGDADGADPDEPDEAPDDDTTLIGEAGALLAAEEPVAHLASRLSAIGAPSLSGTTDVGDYAVGASLVAVVSGATTPDDAVLVVAHHRGATECPVDTPSPCATPARNGLPTAVGLSLLERLVAQPADRTVVVVFVGDVDTNGTGLGALIAPDDPLPLLDPLIAGTVATLRLDSLGEAATLGLRNDAAILGTASLSDPSAIPDLTQIAGLRWHRFAERPATSSDAARLAALGRPLLELTDVAGPCRGAQMTLDDLNPTRADHQRNDAERLLRWMASSTTVMTHAAPGRLTTIVGDLEALAELLRASGAVQADSTERIDELLTATTALLATPTAAWTDDDLVTATEVLTNFDSVFGAEPCASHAPPAPFTDLATDSFALLDIATLADLQITLGTSATAYSPGNPVTREQMAAFLARIWRLLHPDAEPTEPLPFVDVGTGSFAYDDIRLLRELGITQGSGPTTYSPNASVTREQMAAFLARLWRLLFPDLDPGTIAPHPFVDVDADSFAADDISLIYAIEVTLGTSPTSYSPDGSVTREQMAAFLARVLRRHAADTGS